MFSFAASWILWLLPLPFLVWWFVPAAKSVERSALKIPFLHRLQTVTSNEILSLPRWCYQMIFAYFIWALLVIAAAGPRWLGNLEHLPQSGRDIMMAVDLSGSMHIPDMTLHDQPADRLRVVKSVAARFIHARVGDRLGLILFGTRAYLQTPLTFDRKTVKSMLEDATIGLAGQQTALGDAIGLAIKRLMHYPKDNRVLILMTDGASNAGAVTPIVAAKLARKEGIKIYTIGLGADKMIVPGIFGAQIINPSQDLDEHTLKEIASLTGGLFFRAKNSEALVNIYKQLDKIEPVALKTQSFRPISPLYMWPLGGALLLSIVWAFVLWFFPWFRLMGRTYKENNAGELV